MSQHRRPLLSLLALGALLLLVVSVSACGYESTSKEVVEGEPVELGELHYNVTFSRYLNPNDNEDEAYLVGQPEAPKGESYFGVFFEVQNESDERIVRHPTVRNVWCSALVTATCSVCGIPPRYHPATSEPQASPKLIDICWKVLAIEVAKLDSAGSMSA